MKNKTIKILTMMLLFVSMFSVFTGCKDEEFYQPTMAQIEEILKIEDNKPVISGATRVEDVQDIQYDDNAITRNMLDWSRYFERNNIDTTGFMVMDEYVYIGYFLVSGDYITENYKLYIFKFNDCDDASDCKSKLNRYEKFSAKQYGNLVVYADNSIAGHTFALIDTIKE